MITAAAGVADRDADEVDEALQLIFGRIERLRADAHGHLGRIHTTDVDDAELADLIEQADVVGLLDNTRWDPRVLMQLRALRLVLHRPVLRELDELVSETLDPAFVRRRTLEELRNAGIFEGLDAQSREQLETWPAGMPWRRIAAELGALLDARFAARGTGVPRARPLAAVRRPPAARAKASPAVKTGEPAALQPSSWTRDEIRACKVVSRLSPTIAHLLDQLGDGEASGCQGSRARRLLVELGCIDGWLHPDRGIVRAEWVERLRTVEQQVGRETAAAWPRLLRYRQRVRYRSTAPTPPGRAAAALASLLWRRRVLDGSVLSQLTAMDVRRPAGRPRSAGPATRAEAWLPAWLLAAADKAIAAGAFAASSRGGAVGEALEAWTGLQAPLDGLLGPRAGARLAAAFASPPIGDNFLTGRAEQVLVDAAQRRYGDGLREALERVVLLGAAARGLFTLAASAPADIQPVGRSCEQEEKAAYARLETLAGRRPAALIRQAVEAAGPRLRVSMPSPGELRIAVGA